MSTATDGPTSSSPGIALHGTAFGGQQPLAGAHIYLMTAGSTGYGSAATSILTSGDGSDSIGTYVLTDANGRFDVTSHYTCTAGALTYTLATGGNPGLTAGTNNSTAILIDVIGACPTGKTFAGVIPSINLNESTTVAAAFALAAFATDSTHIGTSSTNSAGLIAAFNNAMELVNPYYGAVYTTTAAVSGYSTASGLSGNGTVPTTRINTLADILAACVNSDGTGIGCTKLFAKAPNSSSVAPTDIFTAAVNIAQHPTTNVSELFNLIPTNPPFQPTLVTAPTDWTLSVAYTAPNLSTPTRPAFDASGNLWIPNYGNNSLTQLSPLGVVYSGTTGFTGASLNQPWAVSISPTAGTALVANNAGDKLSKFNANGTANTTISLTGPSYGIAYSNLGVASIANSGGTYTLSLGGLVTALLSTNVASYGVALTTSGSVWSTGLSTSSLYNKPFLTLNTYTGGGLSSPTGMAVDASNNIWVTNSVASSSTYYLSKFNSSGTASSSTGFSGGGLSSSWGLAVDGDGKVFVANGNGSVSEFTSAGAAISPSAGYTTSSTSGIYSVAIDNAGNLWAPNSDGHIYKFVGLAAPVSIPMSNTTVGARP